MGGARSRSRGPLRPGQDIVEHNHYSFSFSQQTKPPSTTHQPTYQPIHQPPTTHPLTNQPTNLQPTNPPPSNQPTHHQQTSNHQLTTLQPPTHQPTNPPANHEPTLGYPGRVFANTMLPRAIAMGLAPWLPHGASP